MKKGSYILFFFFLFLIPKSYSQKNIQDYFNLALPKGVFFEVGITNTIVDSKNQFMEYATYDNSYYQVLLQAKLYHGRKGSDFLLIVHQSEDEQCFWNTQHVYNLDWETDSLKELEFHSLVPHLGFENYVNVDRIKNEVFPHYADSLKNYLGQEDPFATFLEEIYDIKYELNGKDNTLKSYPTICDYMSVNLIAFSEEDWKILNERKTVFFEFKKKSGMFEKMEKME